MFGDLIGTRWINQSRVTCNLVEHAIAQRKLTGTTFAFRAVRDHLCRSRERRESGTQKGKTKSHIGYHIQKPARTFDKNWKANVKKQEIRKPPWTPKPKMQDTPVIRESWDIPDFTFPEPCAFVEAESPGESGESTGENVEADVCWPACSSFAKTFSFLTRFWCHLYSWILLGD